LYDEGCTGKDRPCNCNYCKYITPLLKEKDDEMPPQKQNSRKN
jgi:hypothetical protein